MVIADPVPFNATSPNPIRCRKGRGNRSTFQGQPIPTCDGELKAPVGTSLNPWPMTVNCPKCKLLHIFDVVKGATVYGTAL